MRRPICLLALSLLLTACIQPAEFVYQGPADTGETVTTDSRGETHANDIALLDVAMDSADAPAPTDLRDQMAIDVADTSPDVPLDTTDLTDLPGDALFDATETFDGEVCTPDCDGKECGDDGCGGECGSCGDFGGCKPDNTCLCEFDKCAGSCCSETAICFEGACCEADCQGRECGSDGCGGSCWADGDVDECDDGIECTDTGPCQDGICANATHDELCLDDNPCTTDLCDPALGCIFQNNGLPCDDNEPCTTGDTCAGGNCIGGPPTACDDDVDCTQDFCTTGVGCEHTPNDGLCDDNNVCTTESCDALTGCVVGSVIGDCDDGNACTAGDTCQEGTCLPGDAVVCDDANPCTDDSCAPETGCVFINNDANDCSNDDACDGLESCVEGDCTPGDVPVCDDQVGCTVDSCDAQQGCQYLPSDASCDDANPCTNDVCDEDAGCQFIPDNALVCDDGDECTTGDACVAGECVPGGFDESICGAQLDYDHDGAIKDDDLCPYAFDPGNPDTNGIPGPDACEALADHGTFAYSRPLTLSADGNAPSARRTHEPIEIPLANGTVDDSLVGYWKLDGGLALDYSGKGNHGVVSGPVATQGVFEDTDGALDFNGLTDSVEVTSGALDFPGDAATLAAWLFIESLTTSCPQGGMQILGTTYFAGGPRLGVVLQGNQTGHLFCQLTSQANGANAQTLVTESALAVGSWTHVACSYDGETTQLLVDGVVVPASATSYSNWTATGRIGVGAGEYFIGNCDGCTGSCPDPDAPVNGTLDEVALWSRALSPDELAAYVASFAPYGTPLVPGAQTDYDDIRVTEVSASGDPVATGSTVKRHRIIGPRPHSNTPCPYGEMVSDDEIPGIGDREDLCGVDVYIPLDGSAEDVTGFWGAPVGNATVTTGRFGDQGGALWFNGEDDGFHYEDTYDYKPTAPLTVEAWFKADSIAYWPGQIVNRPEGDDYHSVSLHVANGHLVALVKQALPTANCKVSTPFSDTANWHHAALRHDGTTVTLYLDGLAMGETPCNNTFVWSNRVWRVGKQDDKNPEVFHGKIDDVVIHRVAKSPDYIYHRANPGLPSLQFLANSVVENQGSDEAPAFPMRDYTLHWGDGLATSVAPFISSPTSGPPPCYGLLNGCLCYTAWWRLNEGRGTVAVDSSATKMNGTYVGPINWVPGVEGMALANDFSPAYVLIADNNGLYHSSATLEAAFALGLDVDGETPTNQFLVSKAIPKHKDDFIWNIFHTSGALRFAVEPPGLEQQAIESDSVQWSSGDWHTAAVTLGEGGLFQFVDGIEQADNQAEHTGGIEGEGADLTLGAFLEYEEYFNGLLDSFRIMNRALTRDEFLQFPLSSSHPSQSNWVALDSDNDGILDDGDYSGVAGDNPCDGVVLANCDDNAPQTPNPDQADDDGDGIATVIDNCPETPNPDQVDSDNDGWGDLCGLLEDYDHDGMVEDDLCPLAFDPGNPDDNDIPGPDACEALSDHGEFTSHRTLSLSVDGGAAAQRRTHEPVELPLINGIVDDSLVLYLPFDGDLSDSSLYGHQATHTGSIGYASSASPALGSALDLSNLNNAVETTLSPEVDAPELLTFMAWVNPLDHPNGLVMGRSLKNGLNDDAWQLTMANGVFGAAVRDENNHISQISHSGAVMANAWTHIALVQAPPNALNLYVNGELLTRTGVESLTTLPCELPIYIGASVVDMVPEWSGLIDEVLVFNRALSPQEIGTYVTSRQPWGGRLAPGAQADFDDVRLVENPGPGDPKPATSGVKRSRVIGPRPHSDSPCPATFSGWMPADIPAIADRDDLCGVVGYWKLDGNGDDALGLNPASLVDAWPTAGRFGQGGAAMAFDAGRAVQIPYSESFDAPQFSVEAWVRYLANDPSASTSDVIFSRTDSDAYTLYIHEGNAMFGVYFGDSPIYHTLTAPLPPGATRRWVHIAGSFGAAEMRLYLDGIEVASKAVAKAVKYASQSPIVIGDDMANGLPSYKGSFHGAIDDVVLHAVAKSPDYFYHRANPGMPSLRFLGNTVVENQGSAQSPSFPARSLDIYWGRADAALPFTSVRTAANGKICHGLLNECFGYRGWWRFDDGIATTAVDSSTNKMQGSIPGNISWRHGAQWTGLATNGGVTPLVPDQEDLHVAQGTWEMAFLPYSDLGDTVGKSIALLSRKGSGFVDNYYLSITALEGLAGRLRFALFDAETQEIIELLSDANTWATNTLYATAVTFGEAGMRMVVNGQPQADVDAHAGGIGGTGIDLELGGTLYGVCDSYRLMTRSLTLDEMLQYPSVQWSLAAPAAPTVCDDTVCPVMDGYTVACNERRFCEYANSDPTDWRQWDVWVWIPPGPFAMGRPPGTAGSEDELPYHAVSFATGFMIAKYEVPVIAYEACVADNNACTAAAATDYDGGGWGTNKSVKGLSEHPQNGLSHPQAMAFCAWLADGGRLPTEAEWEYAAKGPQPRPYPWGQTPAPNCDIELLSFSPTQSPADFGCGDGGTGPVAAMPTGTSWCGAHHMAGNVWEWVLDWYHGDYTGAPSDGSAWVVPETESRVRRGGSFAENAYEALTYNRAAAVPADRSAHVGARCARELP